nr:ABC transporter A family member 1 isoform X1 [Ipomoea batatas]
MEKQKEKEEREIRKNSRKRQLRAMLRKNWLLKIRHPYITCAEILLPTIVMLLLIAVRTQSDTQIHPAQAYESHQLGALCLTTLGFVFGVTFLLVLFLYVYIWFVTSKYIQKGMFMEIGKGDKSATFNQILELLMANNEYLAFAPDTPETRMTINILSLKFPLLQLVTRVYNDEEELETYIRSYDYGTCDQKK